MHYRYFRIKDAASLQFIDDHFERVKAFREGMQPIKDEVGAENVMKYSDSGGFAGFVFPKGHAVDREVYKEADGAWLPKKNCKVGRDLWARIKKVPTPGCVHDVLRLHGLSSQGPAITEGMRWYRNAICGSVDAGYFAVIPWYDEDPAVIEQYKKDREAGTHMCGNLDQLLWTPPPEWVEVKEWEMKRDLDAAGVK